VLNYHDQRYPYRRPVKKNKMLRSASSVVSIVQQFKIILILFMRVKPLNLMMLIIICFTVGRPPSGEAKLSDIKDESCVFVSEIVSWL